MRGSRHERHLKRLFGAGLRREHFPFLLSGTPHSVDWFEAISENYMDSFGRPRQVLRRMRENFPIALHGVSMSIGQTDARREEYLRKLRILADEIDPFLVSDHLCFTGAHGNLHDLLPLPYTEEAALVVSRNLKEAQDSLGRQIAIENVSCYLRYKSSEMTEWEFLVQCASRAGARILLDVNNVYVNARNHGFDGREFINSIPVDLVAQMHLAGHTDTGDFLFDTHSDHVSEDVWKLFELAATRFKDAPVLIEWDESIPEFSELEAEVNRARKVALAAENAK
ncbi:MAG TPA: DUF692 domain-containing protein [Leptospiraceae bacterium]|nr:DUF692 domain-containing protein [Leptospiraceae bacterium]HNN59528.1 DUF692 domain-containing protein [Leptospiraceae bacterium]